MTAATRRDDASIARSTGRHERAGAGTVVDRVMRRSLAFVAAIACVVPLAAVIFFVVAQRHRRR